MQEQKHKKSRKNIKKGHFSRFFPAFSHFFGLFCNFYSVFEVIHLWFIPAEGIFIHFFIRKQKAGPGGIFLDFQG